MSNYIARHDLGQDPPVLDASGAALDNTCQITFPREEKRLSRVAERFYLQALARELLPSEKVARCCRAWIPGAQFVKVEKFKSSPSAFYGNLVRCDRIWTCPVCASRISEERRRELTDAIKNNPQYTPALATFTISHHKGMSLRESLALLKKAFDKFMGGRAIQALRDVHEIVGFTTATEVTYGDNGWHPHLHVLVWLEWGADLALLPHREVWRYKDQRIGQLHLDFWVRWKSIIEALGGEVSAAAFDLRIANDAVADYVAKFGRLPAEMPSESTERPTRLKWGVESEITKAVTKKARRGGRTPFQLLSDYGEGDEKAGALFQEYAREFKGRRQLRWSKGLRDLLGLGTEKGIDELVNDDEEISKVLAELDADQWRVVLRNKVRGPLLDVAASGSMVKLWDWLDTLPGMESCSPHYLQKIRDQSSDDLIAHARPGGGGPPATQGAGEGCPPAS